MEKKIRSQKTKKTKNKIDKIKNWANSGRRRKNSYPQSCTWNWVTIESS